MARSRLVEFTPGDDSSYTERVRRLISSGIYPGDPSRFVRHKINHHLDPERAGMHHFVSVTRLGLIAAAGAIDLAGRDGRAEVDYLVVPSWRRGHGHGSEMLQALEGLAREQGAPLVQTFAAESAFDFYRNRGYVQQSLALFVKPLAPEVPGQE